MDAGGKARIDISFCFIGRLMRHNQAKNYLNARIVFLLLDMLVNGAELVTMYPPPPHCTSHPHHFIGFGLPKT